jgi:hypothetical protein
VADKLSDRVKHFFTINEFFSFVEFGHRGAEVSVGGGSVALEMAPGLKLSLGELAQVRHHSVLAHGMAVQAIRAKGSKTDRIDNTDPRRRSQLQWRSNIDDAIQPVYLFLVRRRAIAEILASLFEVAKELLDTNCRREANQDASWASTVVDKRMRNASRSEDRIARAQPKPLIADFDDVFSSEAIEPLVLLFVVVLGWSGSTALDRLLGHEQRATALLGRDLNVNEVAARQLDDVVRPPGSGGHFYDGPARPLGRESGLSERKRDERFDERATSETNADHADLREDLLSDA